MAQKHEKTIALWRLRIAQKHEKTRALWRLWRVRKHGKTQALRILQMTETCGNTRVLWIQGFPISLPHAMVGLSSSKTLYNMGQKIVAKSGTDN